MKALLISSMAIALTSCADVGITGTLFSDFGSITYDRGSNTLETQVNADAIVQHFITPEK